MKAVFLAAAMAIAAPAGAQSYQMAPGMQMPGMTMPAPRATRQRSKRGKGSAARPASAHPRAKATPEVPASAAVRPVAAMPGMTVGMDDPRSSADAPAAMPGMTMPDAGLRKTDQDHAGHDMAAMNMSAPSGTDLPPGNALVPPIAHDRTADRFYGREAMQSAQATLMGEHGGMTFSQILFNLAEYQARKAGDGYRWEGEGWFGGDINRLVVTTEGEGALRGGVDSAEIQALYSRAIDPYWNLQAGVRQDIRPTPARTYATIGIEGMAPYWFELQGAVFVSNKGDVLARVEAYYDQRLTQRLILQPRVELNFAAQGVPEDRAGSGLSNAELGLRLRYEIQREFAPYIGISYDRKVGNTARYARADGERAGSANFVVGIRTRF